MSSPTPTRSPARGWRLEATRGIPFHHYWTNQFGQISKANLIVATGHNNYATSKSGDLVAKRYGDGNNLTEGM